nr:MAG TPA: hypothetical protein [Caudoviricetes sp.]
MNLNTTSLSITNIQHTLPTPYSPYLGYREYKSCETYLFFYFNRRK